MKTTIVTRIYKASGLGPPESISFEVPDALYQAMVANQTDATRIAIFDYCLRRGIGWPERMVQVGTNLLFNFADGHVLTGNINYFFVAGPPAFFAYYPGAGYA